MPQLSIALQLKIETHISPSIKTRILIVLIILHSSHAGNHSCCEFMKVVVLSYLANTWSLVLPDMWLLESSVPFSVKVPEPCQDRDGNIQMIHLWISMLQTHVL